MAQMVQPMGQVIYVQQGYQQPGLAGQIANPQTTNYQVGICECCRSMKNCCICWFCPSILICMQASSTERASSGKRGCCAAYLCAGPLFNKELIRLSYGIDGNLCADFCTLIWCYYCSILRDVNEVECRSGR